MQVTINNSSVPGDAYLKHATITFETYTTGGVAITAADFDLQTIDNVIFPSPICSNGYIPEFDIDAVTIILRTAASPPQLIPNGASLSGVTLDIIVIGK